MLHLFITVSYFVIVLMDMAIRSAVCMYVLIANDMLAMEMGLFALHRRSVVKNEHCFA